MGHSPSLIALGALFLGGCLASGSGEGGGIDDDAVTSTDAPVFLMISEFRPGPAGGASPGFVELFNAGKTAVALGGWAVDDQAGGGASPHVFGQSASIAAGARLKVAFAGINTASADRVRLVDPSGVEIDGQSNFYVGISLKGQCFGRDDATGAWSRYAIPCTPGAPNGSIVPIRAPALINEYKPGSAGFVEIVNRSSGDLDVSGFKVDDSGRGTAAKVIPSGTILAAGAVLRVSYSGINTSSADLVRLLDSSGNELDRRENGFTSASLAGHCFGRIPDGAQWADGAIACSPGALNGYGGATPLSPSALQWIGAFSSPTGAVTSLELARDGTYTATVNGARQGGTFTASGATIYTMNGGATGVAWSATVDPWSGAPTVSYPGARAETMSGYPALEDACDASGGGWTDDDVDTPTGLYCVCPPSKLLIWSAGGCAD